MFVTKNCGIFTERSRSGRLVSGAGDIKLTKDGNVLLHEMVCHFKVSVGVAV